MILVLPVSHLIDSDNYADIEKVEALEYRFAQPPIGDGREGLFHAGCGILQEEFMGYFDSINPYLQENRIKMFSFDLGPGVEKVETIGGRYVPKSENLSKDKIREIISLRLNLIRRRFSGEIALENLNYFSTGAYEHVCEADFISEILTDNNVYMVLDIAHSEIAAYNMKTDIYKYLESLPLSRVRVVHLSAPGIIEGQWCDLHEIPGPKEYAMLEFIDKKVPAETYLAVEYYKDLTVLKDIYEALGRRYAVNKRSA